MGKDLQIARQAPPSTRAAPQTTPNPNLKEIDGVWLNPQDVCHRELKQSDDGKEGEIKVYTYITTVFAKPGSADDVGRFYQGLAPILKEADGFRDRKIFRAQTGMMADAVRKIYTPEELAAHPEPPHEDPGVQFIIIETWDSVEKRMLFSKNVAGSRSKDLIPHLLPGHSHEFYEDITEP